MKTAAIRTIKTIGIIKGKMKLIKDHKTTSKTPTLNKNSGANKMNNPKAKIPFKAPISLIYCR